MFYMDRIFKTTLAIVFKPTRPCSSTSLDQSDTKKGASGSCQAATVPFERDRPNQTAKEDLYICRPNSSSLQLYSFYFGTTRA